MASPRMTRSGLARLALELALVSFTLWLVVQNAVLLALDPWKQPPPALVVFGTLFKVSAMLVLALLPWLAAMLLVASALIVGLTRRTPVGEEVRRG